MSLCSAAILFCLTVQDQQVGARTKAMGGSYTAFEDDPVSVWLNPAGIATQPDAGSLVYQTYTTYPLSPGPGGGPVGGAAEMSWSDPALLPSYLGVVFQLGDPENPHALGFCFAQPFRMKLAYDSDVLDADGTSFVDQAFYRIRAAYAHDFRLRAEGFLTHVAVGLGLDVNVASWDYQEVVDVDPSGFATISIEDQDMGFGGGAGVLIGLYDDTTSFKVNLALAYQSRANFDFSVENEFVSLFDWPEQVQAGATVYLLQKQALRLTVDAQLIRWNAASQDAALPGRPDFQDVVNYSAGLEYRLSAGGGVTLYPRLGLRLYDAPWDDKDALPAIGLAQLTIETEDDRFLIFSAGLGVGWLSKEGKVRQFDLAADVGGDVPSLAMGFTFEF